MISKRLNMHLNLNVKDIDIEDAPSFASLCEPINLTRLSYHIR